MPPAEHGFAIPSENAGKSSLFRVLCVDDNRCCADSTSQLVRAMGFDARACYDGPSALLINDLFRPAVCFLDLNMPEMDGDVLTSRLLAQGGWRPPLLVALTAMDDEHSRARLKAAGCHMHLVKPVDPEKLLAVVEAQLRMGRTKGASTTGDCAL